ncbi:MULTISPECIES: GNAT family N-acetyltransferase [unclassified Brachybacterium]|uniref:GNAT family N-acetyltransferase n=1 Tax=unclassified Brachybacterium TaxID=2623841 RepID=UPI00361AE193
MTGSETGQSATSRPGLARLEQIQPERADEYRDLLQAAYSANVELGVHFGASQASRDDVLTHLRQNIAYGTCDENGALIATVSLRMPWGPNPGYLGLPHIGWLATRPSHAGQGLARSLLSQLEQQVLIGQLHAPAVSLGTAQDHPWLGAYYRRLGFEPVGSRDLGLGHITDFYIRPLDDVAYAGWQARHTELLKGLSS